MLMAALIALDAYFWSSFADYSTLEIEETVRTNEAVVPEDVAPAAEATPAS
jgi:hypothetical protein